MPTTPEQWLPWLRSLSAWVLDHDPPRAADAAQRRTRWLGHPPAPERAVTAAEDRLDTRLPPSLRGFYAVSDGWTQPGAPLTELFGAADLAPLGARVPHLLPALEEAARDAGADWLSPWLPVVRRGVLLAWSRGGWGDGTVVLLDPADRTPDGEAAVWSYDDSGNGGTRHDSFGAWWTAERSSWETLVAYRTQGPPSPPS